MSKEKDFTLDEMLGFVRDASIPNPANIPGLDMVPASQLNSIGQPLTDEERAEYEALKAAKLQQRIADMEAANARARVAISGPNYMKPVNERLTLPIPEPLAHVVNPEEPSSIIAPKLNDFNSGLDVKELLEWASKAETLPDAGSYTEEPDDEYAQVFNASVEAGAPMSLEKIMARRHLLNRMVRRFKIQDLGLKKVYQDKLQHATPAELKLLRDKDTEFYTLKGKPKAHKAPAKKKEALTKLEQIVKTFCGLKFKDAVIIENLKEEGIEVPANISEVIARFRK